MADKENKVTEEVADKEAAKTTKAAEKQAAKDKKAAEKLAASKTKKPLGQRIKKAFKEFKAEFKKIVWSSRRSTFQNTVLVCVLMVVFAVVIGLLDTGASRLLTWIGSLV